MLAKWKLFSNYSPIMLLVSNNDAISDRIHRHTDISLYAVRAVCRVPCYNEHVFQTRSRSGQQYINLPSDITTSNIYYQYRPLLVFFILYNRTIVCISDPRSIILVFFGQNMASGQHVGQHASPQGGKLCFVMLVRWTWCFLC